MTLSRVTPMNSAMINNSERARVLAKRGERERERDCNWFHEGQCKLKARQIRYINRLRPARATLYSVFAVAILRSDWRHLSISTGHYYSLQLSFLLLFLYCLFSSAVTGLDS